MITQRTQEYDAINKKQQMKISRQVYTLKLGKAMNDKDGQINTQSRPMGYPSFLSAAFLMEI